MIALDLEVENLYNPWTAELPPQKKLDTKLFGRQFSCADVF